MVRAYLGSVCFICDGPNILLLHRNHEPFGGKWDGLTGLVEFGESTVQTAEREIYEQAGLKVERCEHRGHLLLYNVDNNTAISADLFIAYGPSGDLRGSEEGVPVWVPIADIPSIDLIDFVHITLPLILVPQTFLIGTIHHRSKGEPVSYTITHYCLGETKVLTLPA